jgi:hypothetical protein
MEQILKTGLDYLPIGTIIFGLGLTIYCSYKLYSKNTEPNTTPDLRNLSTTEDEQAIDFLNKTVERTMLVTSQPMYGKLSTIVLEAHKQWLEVKGQQSLLEQERKRFLDLSIIFYENWLYKFNKKNPTLEYMNRHIDVKNFSDEETEYFCDYLENRLYRDQTIHSVLSFAEICAATFNAF